MKKIKVGLLFVAAVLLWACGSDFPGFDKTSGGLYFKFHVENPDAPKAVIGDVLTVLMTYRTEDSILFTSSNLPEAFRFPLEEPGFAGDIFEGLAMMHLGDSATFIISADSLRMFGNLPPMDSGSVIWFDVKLLSIQAKADFDKEMQAMKEQEMATLEKMRAMEGENILDYISRHKISVQPSETGLYFLPKKNGSGPRAVKGKYVEIHYAAEFLDGEKIFSSRDLSGDPISFELGGGFEIPAVEEALLKMSKGSRAHLIVPSALAYGQSGIRGMVPPYSPLLFDLELLNIYEPVVYKTKMMASESAKIEKYLADNNLSLQADEHGLYYHETRKGSGKAAQNGKTARLHYTATFLNGKTFDSSYEYGAPVEFVIGAGEAIRGWDIGLLYMREGGKARLIIPSGLAYGSEYNGSIPPYTPLLYEVELLSVK